MKLEPYDPAYPFPLTKLREPPAITVSAPLPTAYRGVAIVGSREASDGALRFADELAYHLAKAGVVVLSGGALGVDRAAHRGALRAGGATWCVACTGRSSSYPKENKDIFEEIEQSPSSRMIWPFPDETVKDTETPRFRNGVLVALSECVVVVQAKLQSGSRNAVSWARRLDRRVVVAPGPPWDNAYAGSFTEIVSGEVDVFWSTLHFFDSLGLREPDLNDPRARRGHAPLPRIEARPRRKPRPKPPNLPLFRVDPETWTDDEKTVFSTLSVAPIQQDTIVDRTGLSTSATFTALLTLSLKDVVVEGPDGFFRRRIAL